MSEPTLPNGQPAVPDALAQARYRALFETTLDGILIVDDEGIYIDVNESMCRLLKAPRERLIGAKFSEFIPPARLSEAAGDFSQLKEFGSFEGEFPLRAADGTLVDLEWTSRAHFLPGLHFCVARDVSHRKAIEVQRRKDLEERQRSEARFRTIFESAAVGIAVISMDGKPLQTNPALQRMLGYSDAELCSQHLNHFNHPEDADVDWALFSELIDGTRDSYQLEKRYYRKEGTMVWGRLTMSAGGGLDEGQWHAIAMVEDVTERRAAEEAVRENEERMGAIIDNCPAAIFAKDLEGRFILANRECELMTGVGQEQILGRTSRDFFPRALAEQARIEDERVLREGRPVEFEEQLPQSDGNVHTRLTVKFPLVDRDGRPYALCGVSTDITERRRAVEALRESEERLRLALDAGNCGVWDWDIPANKVTWSERIYEFHGLTPNTFGGRVEDFASLVHPDDSARVSADLRKALDETGSYAAEFRTIRPNGELRWLSTNGRVIRDAAGAPVRMLGATQDVTERRQAEEALREADRRKDEFLAMLAHELRNPLAPVRNAVQVLKLIGPADPTMTQAREMIDRQVSHMARLVDDLLDVSRITRGKILLRRERIDLVRLTRAAVEDHRPILTASGLNLDLDLPPGPLWALGDPTRLAQVIGNLLHNANKFTDAGGRVQVRLETEGSAGAVIIAVRDTGIGLEPEILARLFEPFAQADRSLDRSRGGLGLGLALVKGLVELHGGSVRAASDGVGKGAEFALRLPLTDAAAEPESLKPAAPAEAHSLRILIVEDNRDVAESLRVMLDIIGHQVTVAHTGPAGVDAARRVRPDVLLCDIGLPGGMDGYAVARALKADPELNSTTLIALSGYGQEEDQRKAREAGFDRHLTKPVDPEMLTRLLDTLAVSPS